MERGCMRIRRQGTRERCVGNGRKLRAACLLSAALAAPLQHTVTHCNTLQHTLQHSATQWAQVESCMLAIRRSCNIPAAASALEPLSVSWIYDVIKLEDTQISLNGAGQALRSTSNQSSEPYQVAQHPLQRLHPLLSPFLSYMPYIISHEFGREPLSSMMSHMNLVLSPCPSYGMTRINSHEGGWSPSLAYA